MKTPKTAQGNSTSQYTWSLTLSVLMQKPAGRKTVSWKSLPPILTFHICKAVIPNVTLQVWLYNLCAAVSSFVLRISRVLLLGGLKFSSPCLDNPTHFYSSLGSKLSLTIDGKLLHRTEDKLDVYRINCGDILPHSILTGVSPSTEWGLHA